MKDKNKNVGGGVLGWVILSVCPRLYLSRYAYLSRKCFPSSFSAFELLSLLY